MRVMAIADGFYQGTRRKTGEVFEIGSKADLGKWMKVQSQDTPVGQPKQKRSAPKPTTFSELHKDNKTLDEVT